MMPINELRASRQHMVKIIAPHSWVVASAKASNFRCRKHGLHHRAHTIGSSGFCSIQGLEDVQDLSHPYSANVVVAEGLAVGEPLDPMTCCLASGLETRRPRFEDVHSDSAKRRFANRQDSFREIALELEGGLTRFCQRHVGGGSNRGLSDALS
jgi:hypothetical protein